MSELIACVLIGCYLYWGKPELIISAGLFAIGAEINQSINRFIGGVTHDSRADKRSS